MRCFRPRRKGFGSKLIWIYTLFSRAAFCFAALIAVEAAQQVIPPLLFRVRKRLKLPRANVTEEIPSSVQESRCRKVAQQRRQAVYAYDGWEINIPRLELRSRGVLVPLGSRAFEVLATLVRSSGEVVEKYDLIDRVWPNIKVEENSLRFQIHAIRKALGDKGALLKTVSGRGYCLLGSWTIQESHDESVYPAERRSGERFRTNVPMAGSALFGRAGAKQRLLDVVSAYQVLTLTGPGGIGKSVLGLEIARSLFPEFEGDCWFVPLASLSDPALVPTAVASVLGLRIGGHELSAAAVARSIAGGKVLLVLDNCEHVIDAAAALVEAIQRTCPHAIVLATSREILRVAGEYVYRVPPLDVPPEQAEDTGNLHEYSSVQLFIDRLKALDDGFSVSSEHLPAIVAICRRLDGIPLAIEFAAARVSTLGFGQVVALLNDRFNLLTQGRRTALPQHQTLRATLSWSYELLSASERLLLRRLAIFADGFTLEAVAAVMRDVTEVVSEVAEQIASLVAKSLVARDESASCSRWRLLETIRAYAGDKLTQSGEAQKIARYHSEFYRNLVASGASNSRFSSVEETNQHVCEIGNVRAALDWCFSSTGDAETGLSLTAAFCPVWLDASLLAECRERIERALQHLSPEMYIIPPLRMQLQITLGIVLIITLGPAERAKHALTEGINIASDLKDLDAQIQASWALWALYFNSGKHRLAKSAADRFASLAAQTRDRSVVSVANRIVGYTLQYMGRHQEARMKLEDAIDIGRGDGGRRYALRFLYDQNLLTRASLARSLWLQGFMDRANDLAHACLAEARDGNNKLNLCFVLALAVCPVTLMRGDISGAERFVAMLMETATRQSATQYTNVGRCLEASLMIERGEFAAASARLRAVLDTREKAGWGLSHSEVAGILANSLAGEGQSDEAIATLDWGLANAEEGSVRWYVPELLRIKGEVLRRHKTRELFRSAEDCFREAIAVAKEQGALFWELRATLSLVRPMTEQSQIAEVHRTLSSVYDKFTEGFETADLRSARMMLETRYPPGLPKRW